LILPKTGLFELEMQMLEQSSAKAVFDLCVQKGWYLTQLTPMEKNLEDVFRELTM